MMVLTRGLIFQPVLASLPYKQTCTHNNDTIITLQNILALQTIHQEKKERKKRKQRKRRTRGGIGVRGVREEEE